MPDYYLTHLVREVHDLGIVIADLNHTNIFDAETVDVSLVDVDSFQVIDPLSQKIFRTKVRRAQYVPPNCRWRTREDSSTRSIGDVHK